MLKQGKLLNDWFENIKGLLTTHNQKLKVFIFFLNEFLFEADVLKIGIYLIKFIQVSQQYWDSWLFTCTPFYLLKFHIDLLLLDLLILWKQVSHCLCSLLIWESSPLSRPKKIIGLIIVSHRESRVFHHDWRGYWTW